MPRVRPHYAVKPNPDRRVLKVLVQEGAGFEIASTASWSFSWVLAWRRRIFFSNPVKSRESIAYAAAKGVEWFVVDSATSCGVSTTSRRTPSSTCGSPLPTSAATGAVRQIRAGAGRCARVVALAAKLAQTWQA